MVAGGDGIILENKGYPTRWELDEVAPNNPVAFLILMAIQCG